MKTLIRSAAVLLAACALGAPALASPVVSLHADPGTVLPPGNVALDIVISGLQSGGVDTLLGAFDLTLRYDPAVAQLLLSAPSHLGSGLGDAADPSQTLVGADTSTPGLFRFFEVSLLEAAGSSCIFCTGPFLEDLQDDSFTLATLVFYIPGPVGAGFTDFGLLADASSFGDAHGNAILGVAVQDRLTLTVPEPAGMLLLATAAIAALGAGRARRRSAGATTLLSAVLVAGALASTGAQAAAPAGCAAAPAPITFDQHVYCLGERAGTSWGEARAIAAGQRLTLADGTVLKGHLLTINSAAEQAFVYGTFGSWIDSFGYGQIWLGGYQFSSDVEPAGNWAWVTGEATGDVATGWSFSFLTPGEPGDNTGNPLLASDPNLYNREDALRMLWYCGNRCGRWDDFNRGNKTEGALLRFVIEFDQIGDNLADLRAAPAIVSSPLWRSSATFSAGWQEPDFNDTTWANARAPYPTPLLPTDLMPGTNASFMWHDPTGSSNGMTGPVTAFFRYTFYEDPGATGRPLIGRARISVDDDYDLYVNGQLRNGSRAHDGGFADVVETIDFSSALRKGKNVIAVQAVDGGWAAPGDRLYERVLFDATVLPQADLLVISSGTVPAEVGDGRRYDGRAGAYIGHFGKGCNPLDMAYGPDQKLYVVDTLHPRSPDVCNPAFAVGRFNGRNGAFEDLEDPFARFIDYGVEVPAGRLVYGPGGIAFGPDANLYLSDPTGNSIHRYQGPYGTNPGQFIDTFVAGAGLVSPQRLQFGPDGNLYVASGAAATSILRYQGPLAASPGAFVDTFVAAGLGGLAQAADFAFGRDKRLYVANVGPSTAAPSGVLRFEGPTAAAPGAFLGRLVTLPFLPSSLALGPDGDLYLSNTTAITSGGQVTRYDGLTGAAKGSFATTQRARKILFSAVPDYAADLGDFNHDSCVDLADMNLLLTDVRGPGPHDLARFDLNGDGRVDIADSRKLVLLFTKPGGASCN